MAAKEKGLTAYERRFIEWYAKTGDRQLALRRAGSKASKESKWVQANRILKKPEAQAYLAELREAAKDVLQLEVAQFVQRHMEFANVDPRDYLTFKKNGTFTFKDPAKIPEEAWLAIQSIKETQWGIEVKFVDKLRALQEAAALLGLKKTEGEAFGEALAEMMKLLDGVAQVETEKPLLPGRA